MAETRPRFEAAGRYVIDWEMRRISTEFTDRKPVQRGGNLVSISEDFLVKGEDRASIVAQGLNYGSPKPEQVEWDRPASEPVKPGEPAKPVEQPKRYVAVGKFIVDTKTDAAYQAESQEKAKDGADYWNRNNLNGEDAANRWGWAVLAMPSRLPEEASSTKPDDCPEYYWAAGVQCMEVRNSIIESADFDKIVSSDWGHLFGYVFRMLRKGEPIKDLLKIEHFARIIRLRLEGKRK
jgi:hypothetical protein